MSEPTGAIAPFLSALRTLPFWILVSLAIAGWVILFVPPLGGVDSEAFRKQWGVWVWIEAIGFSILSFAQLVDASIRAYWSHRKGAVARRLLRFVPLHHQCWWHLVKQKDGSYVSQIQAQIQVSNTSGRPIQIVKVGLLRPKAQLIHAVASLPTEGSPYHSDDHPVPPYGTVRAVVDIMTQSGLAAQGKPIRIALNITDQYGEDYTLRNVTVRSSDPSPPKLALSERLRRLKSSAVILLRSSHDADEPQKPIMPWTYNVGSESIGITESILAEEKRNYAANGRLRGRLGSLNVGLQSEPSYQWTTHGEIPKLLWDTGKGTPVTSPNLERLLKVHTALAMEEKDNQERYLLAQLCKESSFAEVAYFVFLALHRVGRTIDAVATARKFLASDKVYAYSNLLGTLSAVVSHEHHNIDPNLYPLILNALAGDDEHDFRLREKINLARLEFLDRERDAG